MSQDSTNSDQPQSQDARAEINHDSRDGDASAIVESLGLVWDPPEKVTTHSGEIKIIRSARPSKAFWPAWKEHKETLKAAGIAVEKDDAGKYTVRRYADSIEPVGQSPSPLAQQVDPNNLEQTLSPKHDHVSATTEESPQPFVKGGALGEDAEPGEPTETHEVEIASELTLAPVTQESNAIEGAIESAVSDLSREDRAYLETREQIVEKGLSTFLDVGHALIDIRDYREGVLYAQYGTFKKYCRERWEIEKSQAYRIIEATQIVDRMSPRGDIATAPMPANEKQVRQLKRLEKSEDQLAAWQEAVSHAGGGDVKSSLIDTIVTKKLADGAEPKASSKTKKKVVPTDDDHRDDTVPSPVKEKSEVDKRIDDAVMDVSEGGHRPWFTFDEIVEKVGDGVTKAAIKRWVARNIDAERIVSAGRMAYSANTKRRLKSLKVDLEEELNDLNESIKQIDALLKDLGDKPWRPI